MDSTPEQVLQRLDTIEARQARMEAQHEKMQASIDDNTNVTLEVKDLLSTFKGGMKFLGWGASAVKWCGIVATGALAMWGFVHALTHPEAVANVFTQPK